jgi:NarL family two-component system sensor histidine kinase YdfH
MSAGSSTTGREEQVMKQYPGLPFVHWRRWFFLGWLVIVYLWSALTVIWELRKGMFCGVLIQHAGGCVLLDQPGRAAEAALLVLFALTLLLAGFGVLLWINLSRTDRPRLFWLFFLVQGILALATGVLVPKLTMALVLLLLALEILFLFQQAALVFGVSCGALLLFILILVVDPPQGSIFWFPPSWDLLGLISFLGLAALLLFVVGYLIVYMQWIRAHARLETAHRELGAIHEKLVAASSQIAAFTRRDLRQRLARDRHDTLAQGLAGLIMQLQVADSCQKEQHYDQAQAIIEQMIQRARTTLAEARQTIDELRRTSLDADELKQAIEQECAHFTSSTAIPCQTELRLLSGLPPALHEHILYAMKEGLSNIARHAHAHTAWIEVTAGEQSVQVEIGDDGIGFDSAAIEHTRGHYGLLGLGERAMLCGGQLEIESSKAEGTRLKLCLPLIGEEVFGDEEHPCRHCG